MGALSHEWCDALTGRDTSLSNIKFNSICDIFSSKEPFCSSGHPRSSPATKEIIMSIKLKNLLNMFTVVALLSGGMVSVAHAEEDDDDDMRVPAANNAKWKTECGACHVAFPPRLLPAESWKAMMSGLDKHFGTDASLDAATEKEIGTFLEHYSGGKSNGAVAKPTLRITETRWFIREHDEVSGATWKNPKVKSPANCAACHIRAERGDYSEYSIRIPK